MANSAIGLKSPIGLQDTRNHIINSEFNLWQRGLTLSEGSTGAGKVQSFFVADRWRYYAQTNSTGNGSTAPDVVVSRRNFLSGVPHGTVNKSNYYLNVFFGSSAAGAVEGGFSGGTGAGNFIALIQDIDDCKTLSSKSAMLSFWAKSDIPNQRIATKLKQSFAAGTADVEIAGYTGAGHTLDNVWRMYKTEFNVPSTIGQAITGPSGDNALQCVFYFHKCIGHGTPTNHAGVTFELAPTGVSGNISLAQVQLEQGTNATEFDKNDEMFEIRQCQRYYEKSYDLDVVPGSYNSSIDGSPDNAKGFVSYHLSPTSTGLCFATAFFATRKRSVPTCTIYHPYNSTNINAIFHPQDDATVTRVDASEGKITRI